MKIVKGTYGTSERPCIWLIDKETRTNQYILLGDLNEFSRDILKDILARLEYSIKENQKIEIEGFYEQQ